MQTTGRPQRSKLMVQEAEVEAGVMRDERRIADELEQFLDLVGEARLVGQEDIGKAVNRFRLARHRPIGIEIAMEVAPGLDPAHHFDAADLDHAVAARGGQSRGLRVENDFAHGPP